MAYKPDSVLKTLIVFSCSYLSRISVTTYLKQPTRDSSIDRVKNKSFIVTYLVLLPVGFTYAIFVTKNPVRSYRTISPLPYNYGGIISVALSLRIILLILAGRYPALFLCGVRTFLIFYPKIKVKICKLHNHLVKAF
jgi:hypothetical protein